MTRKAYYSEKIQVSFEPRRCIHARECVHGLPGVFDVEQRPWIQPGNSDPDTVAEVVTRCPTGALQFRREDGVEEPRPAENVIFVAKDGPLYFRGDIEVREYDGTLLLEDTRLALCRCGESRYKPYCDNSHENSGFRDAGLLPGSREEDPGERGVKLGVKLTPNGPLFLKGTFEIRDAEGATAYRGNQAALCRCGFSGNKPFCDGSHSGAGWRDD
ncbi:MAG: CDGSH iron-sulfur domain-containing protein [Rubrobacteraceae bacterium]